MLRSVRINCPWLLKIPTVAIAGWARLKLMMPVFELSWALSPDGAVAVKETPLTTSALALLAPVEEVVLGTGPTTGCCSAAGVTADVETDGVATTVLRTMRDSTTSRDGTM